LLEALGFIFLDAQQRRISYTFDQLSQIHSFTLTDFLKDKINHCSFYAVNDVLNPLFGPTGAANTYGPQKGGTKEIVNRLDISFKEFTTRFNFPYSHDISLDGGGSAGGTAYGLKVFLNAQFINGFDFLSNIACLEDLLVVEKFDCVISGEGSLDNTSFDGKLIGRLVGLTDEHDLPLLLVCGQSHYDASAITNTQVVELLDGETSLVQCLTDPFPLIENKVSHFFKSLS
jgi:glycerate kinase